MSGLKINGVDRHFPDGVPSTLTDLIETLGFNVATVVAEIDGSIVKRQDFGGTDLQEGQSVELLRFVGGG